MVIAKEAWHEALKEVVHDRTGLPEFNIKIFNGAFVKRSFIESNICDRKVMDRPWILSPHSPQGDFREKLQMMREFGKCFEIKF